MSACVLTFWCCGDHNTMSCSWKINKKTFSSDFRNDYVYYKMCR